MLLPLVLLAVTGCSPDSSESALAGYRSAGFKLIQEDPGRALEMFAKFPSDTKDAQVHLGRGLAHEALHAWKDADRELRLAAELAPNDPGIRTTYARLLVIRRELPAAREQARQALKLHEQRFTAAGLLAVVAETPDQHAEALTALETVMGHAQGRLPAEYLWLATDAALGAGKPEAAQRYAAQAREAKPLEPHNTFLFATTAHSLGKRDLTIALLKTLTQLHTAALDQLLPAIEMALKLGEVGTAGALAKLLPDSPPHPAVHLIRGRLQLLADNPRQAATEFRAGLELHALQPVRRQLTIGLVRALLAGKKRGDALDVVTAWVQAMPEDAGAVVAAAELLGAAGRHPEAIALLEKARARDPVHRDALTLQLGLTLLAAREPAKAESELTPLMEAGEDDAVLPLASALYAQGKRERADALLDRAMEKTPADSRLLGQLARLRIAHSKDGHAMEAVRSRLREASDPVAAGLLLAQVYAELGDLEAVARQLEQLTESFADQPAVWSALAQFRHGQGDLPGAMAAQREALEHGADAKASLQALATWNAEAGHPEESLAALKRLTEIDPLNVVALNNAAALWTDALDQPERAVPLAAKAHELSHNPGVSDTYGWALLRRGKPEDQKKAFELLERASNQLDAPEAHYHFAVALSRQGLDQAAQRLLRSILSREEDFPGKADAAKLMEKYAASDESPKGE